MDSRVARQAGIGFETLLLERVLAPMQDASGEFGEIAVDACARSVAEQDRGGFTSLIAKALGGRDA